MKNFTLVITLIASTLVPGQAWSSSKLFVGGLAWATTSDEVSRLVESFGILLSITVSSVDSDGNLNAFANVEFEGDEDAAGAAAALDGLAYMGETLVAHVTNPRDIIVIGSKVKKVVREAGLRSDGELVQAVSEMVYEMLDGAIVRATANGRSTVRPYDL